MENKNECNKKTCGDQMIIKSIIIVPIPNETFHGWEIYELMSMIQMKINLFQIHTAKSPKMILMNPNMLKFIRKNHDELMKIPSPKKTTEIRMFGIKIVRSHDISETFIQIF